LRRNFSKAFILAAGLGTRLRPLTDRIPKCLVPIQGKPLLDYWLDICAQLEIEEVLINTHHLADQVQEWARNQTGPVAINLVHEKELLGSAGTVAANRDFVREDDNFYIFYSDNLVHAPLNALKSFHLRHTGVLTVGLFRTAEPAKCGIVTLDASGCITSFEEKPTQPKSDLANAGIYIARQSVWDHLPRTGFADFGKDVMPRLVGSMGGCLMGGYLRDVGTPESYRRAQEEWPKISRQAIPPNSIAEAGPTRVQLK
jgi:mannose-1-phosphate guanylyltransferase